MMLAAVFLVLHGNVLDVSFVPLIRCTPLSETLLGLNKSASMSNGIRSELWRNVSGDNSIQRVIALSPISV